jgi:hypothetical protein
VPTAEAAICNRALSRIGQTNKLIDDLELDTGVVAETCRGLYPVSRDAVLETLPWPFATRRFPLVQLSGVTRNGWVGVFSLPADCLVPRYIWHPVPVADELRPTRMGFLQTFAPQVHFVIEDDATLGRVLLTNQATPELVYTAQVTQPPRFTPLFVDALAWHLAADLALALSKRPSVAAAMQQKYELALARAGRASFNAEKRLDERVSPYERFR